MTGISSTKPISKNIGRPMIAPTAAIAHGSARGEALPTMVSTIWSAPPESASSLPNIAPSAISVPTPAAVVPKPVVKLAIATVRSTPATMPTVRAPRVSARNGCSFAKVISATMTAMPISAAATSWASGATGWIRSSPTSGRTVVMGISFAVSAAADWSTYCWTMASTDWSTSMTTPASSGARRSSVANCDVSREVGMKWPGRLACRRAITSRLPSRWRNTTRGAWWRSWSRYLRLRAEQRDDAALGVLVGQPGADRLEPGVAVVVVEASPADILAMLAAGWRSSASANGTRSRCARAAPTTDLPEPETPMTTTSGVLPGASAHLCLASVTGVRGLRHIMR